MWSAKAGRVLAVGAAEIGVAVSTDATRTKVSRRLVTERPFVVFIDAWSRPVGHVCDPTGVRMRRNG